MVLTRVSRTVYELCKDRHKSENGKLLYILCKKTFEEYINSTVCLISYTTLTLVVHSNVSHRNFAKQGRWRLHSINIVVDMIEINKIFLSLGSAVFARKERWTSVERTTQKMVKLQNYDQVVL